MEKEKGRKSGKHPREATAGPGAAPSIQCDSADTLRAFFPLHQSTHRAEWVRKIPAERSDQSEQAQRSQSPLMSGQNHLNRPGWDRGQQLSTHMQTQRYKVQNTKTFQGYFFLKPFTGNQGPLGTEKKNALHSVTSQKIKQWPLCPKRWQQE